MDPDTITLSSTQRMFDYEIKSREIDSITDLDTLRKVAKSMIKLYLKQQETLNKITY